MQLLGYPGRFGWSPAFRRSSAENRLKRDSNPRALNTTAAYIKGKVATMHYGRRRAVPGTKRATLTPRQLPAPGTWTGLRFAAGEQGAR